MNGRSCVVTGSSSGIGAGIVTRLAAQGWHVVGLDLTPPTDPTTATIIGDVADVSAHARAADAAIERAPLGGWVNCAGYNILGSVAELSEADLRRGVEVDLLGVFHGCAEAVRRLLQQPREQRSGAIVNISSIQASVGLRGFAAYAMCKGGIEALTRQVAAEYVADGIRCNAVAPGLIATPMGERLLAESEDQDALRRSWEALTPVGRPGTPTDVAAAVSFLLDEADAGFMTGQVLAVNGGATTLARGQ